MKKSYELQILLKNVYFKIKIFSLQLNLHISGLPKINIDGPDQVRE